MVVDLSDSWKKKKDHFQKENLFPFFSLKYLQYWSWEEKNHRLKWQDRNVTNSSLTRCSPDLLPNRNPHHHLVVLRTPVGSVTPDLRVSSALSAWRRLFQFLHLHVSLSETLSLKCKFHMITCGPFGVSAMHMGLLECLTPGCGTRSALRHCTGKKS